MSKSERKIVFYMINPLRVVGVAWFDGEVRIDVVPELAAERDAYLASIRRTGRFHPGGDVLWKGKLDDPEKWAAIARSFERWTKRDILPTNSDSPSLGTKIKVPEQFRKALGIVA